MDQVRQFTVGPDDAGARLDRWFKRHLPQIGFATISRWARTGQIRVDGKRAAPEDRLAAGQTVRVPPGEHYSADSHVKAGAAGKAPRPQPPLSAAQIAAVDAMVLHRDRAAIVLNKPPGLATQGGSGTHEHVDGLLDGLTPPGDLKAPRPRLVHRLDKDTSGALLIAATPGSAAFFAKRFASRSAQKIYWALVVGVPGIEEGLVDLPLAKQPGTGGEKMMVDETAHGAPARTRYRVIDRAGNRAAWVELQPFTGRTHQLRVHMAAIGHPIVGDGKYGGAEAFLSGSISRKLHLHARRLRIDHPDGTPLDVTAPLPEHFTASLAQLGFDLGDGDALAATLVVDRPQPSREGEKAAAKAHAKQYRKERRGERRTRVSGERGGAGERGLAERGGKAGLRAGKAVGKAVGKAGARPSGEMGTKKGAKMGGAKPFSGKTGAKPGTKPRATPRKPPFAGPRASQTSGQTGTKTPR